MERQIVTVQGPDGNPVSCFLQTVLDIAYQGVDKQYAVLIGTENGPSGQAPGFVFRVETSAEDANLHLLVAIEDVAGEGAFVLQKVQEFFAERKAENERLAAGE